MKKKSSGGNYLIINFIVNIISLLLLQQQQVSFNLKNFKFYNGSQQINHGRFYGLFSINLFYSKSYPLFL